MEECMARYCGNNVNCWLLFFDIFPESFHRALADVWTTARLMEAVAQSKDVATLEKSIGKMRGQGGQRSEREEIIAEAFANDRHLPDLQEIASEYGVKVGTVEGDVLRLIKSDRLPADVLANQEVQTWLADALEPAIRSEWHGHQNGRLKPLMERLCINAPAGFDYTQLKLALIKHGKAR